MVSGKSEQHNGPRSLESYRATAKARAKAIATIATIARGPTKMRLLRVSALAAVGQSVLAAALVAVSCLPRRAGRSLSAAPRSAAARSGHWDDEKAPPPFPEIDDAEQRDHDRDREPDNPNIISRRRAFSDVLSRSAAVAACGCLGCAPRAAHGLAQIVPPSLDALSPYDQPRNMLQDAAFAQGMAVGMVDYEREAFPVKKRLFQKLFASLEGVPEATVAEVGMGSFPNAIYYKKMEGLDIIGIDPNDRMEGYARDSAARAGIVPRDNLRIVHGVSEALPLADATCDAVVCTLTLCSVIDQARSVAEIRRVLKPGGKFLFWEHVLSQTDPILARRQVELTPNQVRRADGCHLDRRTGDIISAAGFKRLDQEYMELKNFGFLNPTVFGIATA